MNKYLIFIMVLTFQFCFSQDVDSLYTKVDSIQGLNDSIIFPEYSNRIINDKAIGKSLQILDAIENKQFKKLRVVHIGDSHIQADIMTDYMRQNLQNKFGNAGLGFVFPYKMAMTNGSHLAKLTSDISFNNYRNIKVIDTLPVGLSGIAFYTDKKDFSIELNVKDNYKFNSIRVITPNNQNSFFVANSFEMKNEIIQTEVPKEIPKKITGYTTKKINKTINHKIKKGEVLSIIANKYDVSVSEIKKANNLKSDNINYGKTLKIPTIVTQKIPIEEPDTNDIASVEFEIVTKEVTTKKFLPLNQISYPMSHDYYNLTPMDKIFIIPNTDYSEFALNGIALENSKAGVIYSAIGVNGAKCSDFNKYDMFYQQLPALEPNLIVISFGTNESFDKLDNETFIERLNELIDKIRLFNFDVEILVTTPQPSQFGRKNKNYLVEQYTKSIIDQAEIKNYAVWDMYNDLGGAKDVNTNYRNGLITSDKVHYTYKGYKKQADDFFEAFMQSYQYNKSGK
ncbi:LysM peptidoglycan-binding domain-containing protein [uncultured Flavobacterium sp.]|uniref:LysM peptidoglycan-binding domain-containing protein n=1 Tax=uncultured Flavobacterium sp. TaxID=165435 RepID=UPI0030EED79A|tara:strand:- start:252814 stop:254343 length:1530 start_codon:yes stop_codon:yes gene_type:complete